MMNKILLTRKPLHLMLIGAMLWTLCAAGVADAQRNTLGRLEAGTLIKVRTSEPISVRDVDDRTFLGVVDQDVINTSRSVAIPKGSQVELLVKSTSDNELTLDLDSVVVNGRRYGIEAEDASIESRRDGIGVNQRTGKYVGGGAVLGAVIGAIAGGGKGAAVGAGVGAAAGAGTQVLTRGSRISIPAESLITFRLERPLQTPVLNTGYSRNGGYYHPGYGGDHGSNAAYRAGLLAGRSDFDRDLASNPSSSSSRWRGQDRRDYEAGYRRGYDGQATYVSDLRRDDRRNYSGNRLASVDIGRNKMITWQAPGIARVYVQVDNNPRKLFAEGQSGVQAAPWIETGHQYTFIVLDRNGNELARDHIDLRQTGRR